MKKIIATIVVLALVLLAAQYWVSFETERWYENAVIEASSRPTINLVPLHYQRGLFVSRATTRVEIMPDPEAVSRASGFALSTHQEIFHGPLPWTSVRQQSFPFLPAAAIVRQWIDPDSADWLSAPAKTGAGRVPLEVISRVGFDGASVTWLNSPLFTLENVADLRSLRIDGLQAVLRINPSKAEIAGDWTLGGLELILAQGPSALPEKLHVRQVSGSLQRTFSASHFAPADYRGAISAIRIDGNDGAHSLLIEGLEFGSTITERAQHPLLLDAEQHFRITKITLPDGNGSGSFRLEQKRFNAEAMERMQEWLAEQDQQSDLKEQVSRDEFLGMLNDVLREHPEIRAELRIQSNRGDLDSELVLRAQELGKVVDITEPQSLLKMFDEGTLALSLDRALADFVATAAGLSGEYQRTIDSAVADGTIRAQGDRLVVNAAIEQGRLLLSQGTSGLPPRETTSTRSDAKNQDGRRRSGTEQPHPEDISRVMPHRRSSERAVVAAGEAHFRFPLEPDNVYEWCSGGLQYGWIVKVPVGINAYDFGFFLFTPTGAAPCTSGKLPALLEEGQFSIWKRSGEQASIVPDVTVHHSINADATELTIKLTDISVLQLLFSSEPERAVMETRTPNGSFSELVAISYQESRTMRPPQAAKGRPARLAE